MRRPIQVAQFKRDVKLCIKRNKDMQKLRHLMLLIIEAKILPLAYQDHALKGNWRHHRDSHLEPDWLLIYKIAGNDVYFVRTGSHADIFGA